MAKIQDNSRSIYKSTQCMKPQITSAESIIYNTLENIYNSKQETSGQRRNDSSYFASERVDISLITFMSV